MTKKLLPKTRALKYWRLAEECGEVTQCLSKINRFGLNNKREGQKLTNKERLLEELSDLKHAIKEVEKDVKD